MINYLLGWLESADSILAYIANLLAVPSTLCFLGTGLYLTVITGVIQLRALPLVCSLLNKQSEQAADKGQGVISPFRALFTSMASTIGMGNIIGPSVAILTGGPGALFWLLLHMLVSGATKYAEVCFAIATRAKTATGTITGGPMRYLSVFSPALATWYAIGASALFALWSSMQSHTLAQVLSFHGVSPLLVGTLLAGTTLMLLRGGVERISAVAAQLVPFMFALYLCCGVSIIWANAVSVGELLGTIFHEALNVKALTGGLLSASIFHSMHVGIRRGVFITEAGLGTSSISHALADVRYPSQQGVLAMYSLISDMLLSLLSGLIVISSGIASGSMRNTLVYEAFTHHWPMYGALVFVSVSLLFVFTTVLGNSFAGTQAVATLSKRTTEYQLFTAAAIVAGSILPVQLLWNLTDMLLLIVALPNAIGLVLLSRVQPEALSLHQPNK